MFKVYEKAEEVKGTYLQLRQNGEDVVVCVVDAHGYRVPQGYIATFGADGTLYRHTSAPDTFFQTDALGRIKLSDDG